MLKNVIAAVKLSRATRDAMNEAMRDLAKGKLPMGTLDNVQADLATLTRRLTLLEKETRALTRKLKE